MTERALDTQKGQDQSTPNAFSTGVEACSPFYKESTKGRRARQRVNTRQGFHQRVESRLLRGVPYAGYAFPESLSTGWQSVQSRSLKSSPSKERATGSPGVFFSRPRRTDHGVYERQATGCNMASFQGAMLGWCRSKDHARAKRHQKVEDEVQSPSKARF